MNRECDQKAEVPLSSSGRRMTLTLKKCFNSVSNSDNSFVPFLVTDDTRYDSVFNQIYLVIV